MDPINSTLVHVVAPPRNGRGASSHPTVILLHGLGADEYDLFSLADQLDERLLVISARAPNSFEYGGGYAWYGLLGMGMPEPLTHADSYQRILKFVDDCKTGYPVDPNRIFLLGFSMGAMMAFTVSLAQPELFAGVIAQSGYIPEGTTVEYHWDRLQSIEYFVTHGVYDSVVPVQLGRKAKELLEKGGAHFEYHEYPMAHEISQSSLTDIARWLTQRIDRTGSA